MRRQSDRPGAGASDGVADRVEALLRAGDNRAAAACARRCLSDERSSAREREAALAVLARVRPDRLVALAAGGGLALFLAVALLAFAAGR